MNELEKAYNGIEDAIGSLDYEGNYDVDTPRESLEYIKIYITNLQSKIDKAIEYIEKEKYVSADENCEIIAGYHIYELLDILKEEQPKETKELFEGTMDQLNDLSIFMEDK